MSNAIPDGRATKCSAYASRRVSARGLPAASRTIVIESEPALAIQDLAIASAAWRAARAGRVDAQTIRL